MIRKIYNAASGDGKRKLKAVRNALKLIQSAGQAFLVVSTTRFAAACAMGGLRTSPSKTLSAGLESG